MEATFHIFVTYPGVIQPLSLVHTPRHLAPLRQSVHTHTRAHTTKRHANRKDRTRDPTCILFTVAFVARLRNLTLWGKTTTKVLGHASRS